MQSKNDSSRKPSPKIQNAEPFEPTEKEMEVITKIIRELQQNPHCSKYETWDLKMVHKYIREISPHFFAAGKYVEVRNLILIGENIDNELENRGEAADFRMIEYLRARSQKKARQSVNVNSTLPTINRPFYSTQSRRGKRSISVQRSQTLDEFDRETEEQLQKLQKKHDKALQENSSTMSKTISQNHFKPSHSLKKLKRKVDSLKKSDDTELYQKTLSEYEKKKDREKKEAEKIYQKNLSESQKRIQSRQNYEIESFLQERQKQRYQLRIYLVNSGYRTPPMSKTLTRASTPFKARTGSPFKPLPLLSYTKSRMQSHVHTTTNTPAPELQSDQSSVKSGTPIIQKR